MRPDRQSNPIAFGVLFKELGIGELETKATSPLSHENVEVLIAGQEQLHYRIGKVCKVHVNVELIV